jgi:hypothetical protein
MIIIFIIENNIIIISYFFRYYRNLKNIFFNKFIMISDHKNPNANKKIK